MTRLDLLQKAGKHFIKLAVQDWIKLYLESTNTTGKLLDDESDKRLNLTLTGFRKRVLEKYKKYKDIRKIEKDLYFQEKLEIPITFQRLTTANKGEI